MPHPAARLTRARVLLALAGLVAALGGCGSPAPEVAGDAPTFTRDVAPIVFEHCSPCHRPGESAPFSLLTYHDVRKRARQIVDVTQTRFMPPWLPEPGEPAFAGERRLSDRQIATLVRWVRAGTVEGDPDALPAQPVWTAGWQLGEPDLVVTLEETYVLPAEGTDVFRNFVLASGVSEPRWVEAVEIRPGNKRIVHHAILQVDRTPATRRRDALDPGPGFGGMELGHSLAPDGHFIGWTPGKMPFRGVAGGAWRLDPGTDLVLQLHLLPSGKPEPLRPSIGLYFTDAAPTIRSSVVGLYIEDLDIPPGDADHVREDRFRLPVPVDVLVVYPHAHYLGKSVRAWAELPGGGRTRLIEIDDWDFNWQDDYRYAEPVPLPAGSEIVLRWVYDNSRGNVRNPNDPPRRVRSGDRSTDEMGSLSLQVRTRDERDRALLAEATARDLLAVAPDSPRDLNNLGNALADLGRPAEALPYYHRALALAPDLDDVRYNLGIALAALDRPAEAIAEFRHVLRLNPEHAAAHNNLGRSLLSLGRTDEAIAGFRRAAELQPSLAVAHFNLGNALLSLGQHAAAAASYRTALRVDPGHAMAHNNLGTALHLLGRIEEAADAYRAALAREPDHVEAHTNLGIALAEIGRRDEALAHWRRALEIDPGFELARTRLDAALDRR